MLTIIIFGVAWFFISRNINTGKQEKMYQKYRDSLNLHFIASYQNYSDVREATKKLFFCGSTTKVLGFFFNKKSNCFLSGPDFTPPPSDH